MHELVCLTRLPYAGDTQTDLQALTAACKDRDMLFMLDVVANHVGESRTPPFDEQSVVSIQRSHNYATTLVSYHRLRYRSDSLCRSAAAAWPRAEFSEGRTNPYACTKTKPDVATVGTPESFVDVKMIIIFASAETQVRCQRLAAESRSIWTSRAKVH